MAFLPKKPASDDTPASASAATIPPVAKPGTFRPPHLGKPGKPGPEVKVLRRPAPASQTEVPKELAEYFQDQGCQVHFVWADARLLAQESTYGRFPIQVEDLPEDLVKKIRPWFEDPAKHGGQLRRSDAVVVYQSMEARDAWRLEAVQQEHARENAFLHQGDEIEARLRAAGLRGTVDASRVTPIAGHVIGGPELMKMLEEAEDSAAVPG